MQSAFVLVESVRPGSSNKTERRYVDFCPDDVPVFSKTALNRDLTSVLWLSSASVAERDQSIFRLLKELPADLPDDRVSIYVCGECGDIGCGALTAKIEMFTNEVVWSDFGFENNYENFIDRELYSELGPYTFDRCEYEMKLCDLLSTTARASGR